jgi:hypothetical protein
VKQADGTYLPRDARKRERTWLARSLDWPRVIAWYLIVPGAALLLYGAAFLIARQLF